MKGLVWSSKGLSRLSEEKNSNLDSKEFWGFSTHPSSAEMPRRRVLHGEKAGTRQREVL